MSLLTSTTTTLLRLTRREGKGEEKRMSSLFLSRSRVVRSLSLAFSLSRSLVLSLSIEAGEHHDGSIVLEGGCTKRVTTAAAPVPRGRLKPARAVLGLL